MRFVAGIALLAFLVPLADAQITNGEFNASANYNYYVDGVYCQQSDNQSSNSSVDADAGASNAIGNVLGSPDDLIVDATLGFFPEGWSANDDAQAQLSFSFDSAGQEWFGYGGDSGFSSGSFVADLDGSPLLLSGSSMILSPGAHQLLLSFEVNNQAHPSAAFLDFSGLFYLENATPEPSALIPISSMLGLSCIVRRRKQGRSRQRAPNKA